jgi:hypothetical protein
MSRTARCPASSTGSSTCRASRSSQLARTQVLSVFTSFLMAPAGLAHPSEDRAATSRWPGDRDPGMSRDNSAPDKCAQTCKHGTSKHRASSAGQVSEGALVSEYEESAGPDETVPGPNTKEPDPDPPRSRRAGATRAAGTVAGALTSRTAGWIVAAALGGSLVTLAVDNGTSQPTAGPIAIRNADRTAPAPALAPGGAGRSPQRR